MALSLDVLVLGPGVSAFGEVAQGYPVPVYTPQIGAPFEIDGVFDAGYREVEAIAGPPVTSLQPTFGLRLSQVPIGITLSQEDGVTIRGLDYVVREVRPDSHGHVRLMLNLASMLPSPLPGLGIGPRVRVIPKTADYTVLGADSGVTFTNAGANGPVRLTLPAAAAGLVYGFIVRASSALIIGAAPDQTIAIGGSVTAAGGAAQSAAAGATLVLMAGDAGGWEAAAAQGPWALE